jgi:hypothetical protein
MLQRRLTNPPDPLQRLSAADRRTLVAILERLLD